LKQRGHILDLGAVPSDSTKREYIMKLKLPCFLLVKNGQKLRLWKNKRVIVGPTMGYVLFWWGRNLGSTGVKMKWSLPDDCVIGQNY